MRQVCNLSYVVQLEGLDETETRKFLTTLEAPPRGYYRRRTRVPRTDTIDPSLAAWMPGGGVA